MTTRGAASRTGPSEAEVQRLIVDYLCWRGFYVQRLNTGGLRQDMARMRRGTPDLLALRRGDPPTFIEVKAAGGRGRVSAAQRETMADLERHGARCLVATSVEDVIAALGEIA